MSLVNGMFVGRVFCAFLSFLNCKFVLLFQNHSRLVIIFETPQSSCSRFLLKLERNHPDLKDVILEDWRLMNAYNIQVTVPSNEKQKLSKIDCK